MDIWHSDVELCTHVLLQLRVRSQNFVQDGSPHYVLSPPQNDCPTPGVLCPKKIVQDQMFIDFIDVEIVWHTELFGNIFYMKKINKHLMFLGHKTPGVGQSFWDGGSS